MKKPFYALLIYLLSSTLALASSLRITWSANGETDLLGYRVYWGTVSKQYTHTIDVGKVTQCEITDLTFGHRYFFSITAIDLSGNESNFSQEVSYTYGETRPMPDDYELERIRPNPLLAGQSAIVRFAQPQQQLICLAIYNSLGQKVDTIFQGEHPAGYHQFPWQGQDENGRPLPSGVYFLRLQAANKVFLQPITVLH